jgi:hypothetical protein
MTRHRSITFLASAAALPLAALALAGCGSSGSSASGTTTAPTTSSGTPATRRGKDRVMAQETVSYERDIRPLFREGDIESMSAAFDLSSYDDVRAIADAIYERLAEGSMPCDGGWPVEEVQRFRTWMNAGLPA